MVVRQTCSRHGNSLPLSCLQASTDEMYTGRSVLPTSSRFLASRQYATMTSMSEASRILASIEKRANELERNQKNLQREVFAKIAERLTSAFTLSNQSTSSPNEPATTTKTKTTTTTALTPTEEQFTSKRTYDQKQEQLKRMAKIGSSLHVTYDPRAAFKNPPTPSELTLPMLMAAQTHLGHATALWNPRNSSYIFGIRDGIHIISLDATYAYLRRAARVVQEVARKGGMILFVGTRDKQEEIVVKAAEMASGYHIFDRWVPGSLTNGQQILGDCSLKVVDVADKELPDLTALLNSAAGRSVLKPDLVVCLNPLENEVCLHECRLHTVPTIGVIDTDADASWVTYPIPANDDSMRSITLIAGVLGHAGAEGQQERLKMAKLGQATYDTKKAKQLLAGLREMGDMRIEAKEGGSK
jgi:small subunit ribosomal protein S2